MKRIINIIGLAIITLIIASCEKETEDISFETNYATFEMSGDNPLAIAVGTTFSDPGIIAIAGEEELEVESSTNLDENTIGIYTINYAAVNADGYPATTSRTVAVYDPNAPETDISGTYSGLREGASGGGPVNIEKVAPGIFYASDLFGGYYELVAGYGSAYRLRSYIRLYEDNTIEELQTTSPWGPWEVLNGQYTPLTGTISYTVDQDGFQFNVTLTK